MVLKRRVNYGFTGFQVPVIPRAPRSARVSTCFIFGICFVYFFFGVLNSILIRLSLIIVQRRSPLKNSVEDGEACAFEILASLAGKLLQESESSACSNASEGNHHCSFSQGIIVQDRKNEVKPSITEGVHQGSCTESIFTTNVASKNNDQKPLLHAKTDCSLGHISVNNNSDNLEKAKANVKTETVESDNKYGSYTNRLVKAPENFRKSCNRKVKKGFRLEQEAGVSNYHRSTSADKCGLKDRLELYMSPALVDSKVNVKKYPLHRKPFPTDSFTKRGNGIKLDFRDDDENFIRYTKVCAKSKAFRSPRRIAHRRIKNLLSSKYWKVAPKLKDCELSRSGKCGTKCILCQLSFYCVFY